MPFPLGITLVALSTFFSAAATQVEQTRTKDVASTTHLSVQQPDSSAHLEVPDDEPQPSGLPVRRPEGGAAGGSVHSIGPFISVQVNVGPSGANIPGDAANEPSIALDPTDPSRIAIGWRQFDTVTNNFRQAGVAFSQDGGASWTFPGPLDQGNFRSDPVLEFDADGAFYYYSLRAGFECDVYRSYDGGATWEEPVFAYGGDKEWLTIDRTDGIGRGHIYGIWNAQFGCCGGALTRSTDGGETYDPPLNVPNNPFWGTMSVGPQGNLFITGLSGIGYIVVRSSNAQDAEALPVFDQVTSFSMGGGTPFGAPPNPGGLSGQIWVATDHSDGPTNGNVYVLATIEPFSGGDPADIMFARSTDGGASFSPPIRVNDDPTDNDAFQWFGTLSVAPNGRLDVIWNDTRNTGDPQWSEVFYSYSVDGGSTWTKNIVVSKPFDSTRGWPDQNKIGDYYDMVSDDDFAHLAYSATFNGEQDTYYLRISRDCNGNGTEDLQDIDDGISEDCDGGGIPDECEDDFDGDGAIDACDDDIDGDGIPNEDDVCDHTALPGFINPDGSQIGDIFADCDVDLDDFGHFAPCLQTGGPNVVHPVEACTLVFDYDGDEDIDLVDFRYFQLAFTGALP